MLMISRQLYIVNGDHADRVFATSAVTSSARRRADTGRVRARSLVSPMVP